MAYSEKMNCDCTYCLGGPKKCQDTQPLTVEEEARAQAKYFKQGAHLIPKDLWYENGVIWGIRFGEDRAFKESDEWKRKAGLLLDQNAAILMENHKMRKALEKIAAANPSKHLAHPQSVWWRLHIVTIAVEALKT